MAKKPQMTKSEKRSLRMQQMVFLAISILIIMTMVLSLVVK